MIEKAAEAVLERGISPDSTTWSRQAIEAMKLIYGAKCPFKVGDWALLHGQSLVIVYGITPSGDCLVAPADDKNTKMTFQVEHKSMIKVPEGSSLEAAKVLYGLHKDS